MSQQFLPRRSRLAFGTLGALAVLAAAAAVLVMPQNQASGEAKPGTPEATAKPRPADPPPLYADIEPAKNPRRLCVQDDGRKVLGWVGGSEDFAGRRVRVLVDQKEEARLEVG